MTTADIESQAGKRPLGSLMDVDRPVHKLLQENAAKCPAISSLIDAHIVAAAGNKHRQPPMSTNRLNAKNHLYNNQLTCLFQLQGLLPHRHCLHICPNG